MIQCETVPATTVVTPRKYIITLTEEQARQLTIDLIRYRDTYCPSQTTSELLDLLGNRNNT